jgi:glycosyltransferase involved in cell wall biosynthesis
MPPLRLLLVAYAFPPLVNAQAIRWLMLVRELAARGADIDVLTVRTPDYFTDLLDEVPSTVAVHRTWAGPIEGISRVAKASVRSEDQWIEVRRRGGPHQIARAVYRSMRRVADGALIPDLCSEWLPFAVARGLTLVRERQYDALISSSEPGVGHLAGWMLKRSSGLPWLADFGDPWVGQSAPVWRRRADLAVERGLLRAMDGITVTVPQLARVFEERHPWLRPVRVVRQGFDRDLLTRATPDRRWAAGPLNVVYTGTLYAGLRDPAPVFEALRLARDRGLDVVLTVAGRLPESMIAHASRLGLAGALDFVGILPYKDALALQKGADVLLYLDNTGAPLQVPGKLYEYLGARRPILVVRNAHESPATLAVRTGRCGRDVPSDPVAIADALGAFAAERRAGRELLADDVFADEYTFARSADELCLAIEETIERHGVAPVDRRPQGPRVGAR